MTAATQGRDGDSPAGELSAELLAEEIAHCAADKKAQDIVDIDLSGMAAFTDHFVVCSGNTERQTKAIHDAILHGLRSSHGLRPRRVEGLTQSRWILMDYLDVVVHIFTPPTRDFYRLEALWGEAPRRRYSEPAGALA